MTLLENVEVGTARLAGVGGSWFAVGAARTAERLKSPPQRRDWKRMICMRYRRGCYCLFSRSQRSSALLIAFHIFTFLPRQLSQLVTHSLGDQVRDIYRPCRPQCHEVSPQRQHLNGAVNPAWCHDLLLWDNKPLIPLLVAVCGVPA